MEMRSVTSTPVSGNSNKNTVKAEAQDGETINITDKISRLQEQDNEFAEQISGLRQNISSHNKSKKNVEKKKTILRVVVFTGAVTALAGLSGHIAIGAIGVAIGAVGMVVQGYFNGRSEWFQRKASEDVNSISGLKQQRSSIGKKIGKIEDNKAEIDKLGKAVKVKKSDAIKDEGDSVIIGGVKLRKHRSGVMRYFDDLFGPLE